MPLPGPGVRQHRLFDMRSVHRAPVPPVGVEEVPPPCAASSSNHDNHDDTGRFDAIYIRVSTNEQTTELNQQLETLQQKHPDARIFRDVASGMNFRRPALRALLGHVFAGRVQHVYVADRERLCRFAYELVEFVLQSHGCEIVVEASSHPKVDQNKELADDIVNTVTVFAAHLYGARSGGKRHRDDETGSEENAKRASVQRSEEETL